MTKLLLLRSHRNREARPAFSCNRVPKARKYTMKCGLYFKAFRKMTNCNSPSFPSLPSVKFKFPAVRRYPSYCVLDFWISFVICTLCHLSFPPQAQAARTAQENSRFVSRAADLSETAAPLRPHRAPRPRSVAKALAGNEAGNTAIFRVVPLPPGQRGANSRGGATREAGSPSTRRAGNRRTLHRRASNSAAAADSHRIKRPGPARHVAWNFIYALTNLISSETLHPLCRI